MFLYPLKKRHCKKLLLALLVSNCAGSLASGLTGSLASAAAALFSCLLEVSLVDSLDMLHIFSLHKK